MQHETHMIHICRTALSLIREGESFTSLEPCRSTFGLGDGVRIVDPKVIINIKIIYMSYSVTEFQHEVKG